MSIGCTSLYACKVHSFRRLEHERDKKALLSFDRAFLCILSRPCFHTVHKCRQQDHKNNTCCAVSNKEHTAQHNHIVVRGTREEST